MEKVKNASSINFQANLWNTTTINEFWKLSQHGKSDDVVLSERYSATTHNGPQGRIFHYEPSWSETQKRVNNTQWTMSQNFSNEMVFFR